MGEDEKAKVPGLDVEGKSIRFDYIKGNYYRVIHVDGVIGGPSPRGTIFMSVWNERWPIPKQTAHDFHEGKLGKEIESERVFRDSVIREVEAGLIMDIGTAKQIVGWLDEKIKDMEKSGESSPEEKINNDSETIGEA